jgi:hypothetical protein
MQERDHQGSGKRRSPSPSPIQQSWAQRAKEQVSSMMTPVMLDLPSGLRVMARRVNMMYLLKLGLVPDPLSAAVADWIAKIDGSVEELEKEAREDTVTALKKFRDFLWGVWIGCVVDPPFTDDDSRLLATEPPFHVSIVEENDLLYLMQWAQGVDRSVESFLSEQDTPVGSVVNGASVPVPA